MFTDDQVIILDKEWSIQMAALDLNKFNHMTF
jgi:hypothetical protein